jgi:hypothetical protein
MTSGLPCCADGFDERFPISSQFGPTSPYRECSQGVFIHGFLSAIPVVTNPDAPIYRFVCNNTLLVNILFIVSTLLIRLDTISFLRLSVQRPFERLLPARFDNGVEGLRLIEINFLHLQDPR